MKADDLEKAVEYHQILKDTVEFMDKIHELDQGNDLDIEIHASDANDDTKLVAYLPLHHKRAALEAAWAQYCFFGRALESMGVNSSSFPKPKVQGFNFAGVHRGEAFKA